MNPDDAYAAWLMARVGKVTSSNLWKVVKQTKAGPSQYRASYMLELIAEKLTGQPTERQFLSDAMRWGIETEPKARTAYEQMTGEIVEVLTPGFVDHPVIPISGCSPDGFVGRDGMIEIKCPETRTHINTILQRIVKDDYTIQMQWQMACCGRDWCDFVSFDPRLPLSCRMFKVRVRRDEKLIKGLEKQVITFLDEMRQAMEVLEGEAHVLSEHVDV